LKHPRRDDPTRRELSIHHELALELHRGRGHGSLFFPFHVGS
jgi:hypothetical protein